MLAHAIHGQQAGWGFAEELLATTVDMLGVVDYHLRAAHFKGPHTPPQLFPRPGADTPDAQGNGLPNGQPAGPRMSSRSEIAAFFGGEGTAVHVDA